MAKLCLPLLLFALLALACGRSSGNVTTGEWQPASSTTPRFEATLPRLLIQRLDSRPYPPAETLDTLDLIAKTTETEQVSGAGNLAALLAAEYRLVGNVLLDQENRIYRILGGRVAPNGLWTAQEQDNGLVLRRVDDAGMLTLSASGRAPVWSADSQWLAYQDDTGLWLVDLADLSRRPLAVSSLEPLAWSPDGRYLLLRNNKNLIVMDVAGRQQRTLNNVDAGQIHGQPFWSTDGQEIYARYGENGRNTSDVPLARLVAIKTDGSRNPIRDLLPVSRNRGVTGTISLSPDGQALLVYHIHQCGYRSQAMFPWPARYCDGAHLLVESASGHYETVVLPSAIQSDAIGWERPWPPVNLADLPLPPEPLPTPPEAAYTSQPWPTIAPTFTPEPPSIVPFGETAANNIWAVTLLDLVRGDAAWEQIETAVHNIPTLPTGQEYLLARVRLQYVGHDERSPMIARTNFELIDAAGNALERVTAVPPPPALDLFITLTPDETHEGWIILMVPVEADATLRLRTGIGRHDFLYLALP